MAADILTSDITNDAGTGVFDKLMAAVNAQIETQYLNNRITGSDYANVYLGSMQAVLQQSVQYVLQEQLTEAQVDDVTASTALKASQKAVVEAELNKLQNTTEAELEKQWGYTVTRDLETGSLVLGASTSTGKIDKEVELLATEEQIKQYNYDSLLPEEYNKLLEEIKVLKAQLANAYTDRVLKDKQAAKLGLDNVMKNAETSRTSDATFVYTPQYEEAQG